MKSIALRTAVLASLLVLSSPTVQAGNFLAAYTGNTIIGQPTPLTDAVANFGVYRNTGANFFVDLFGAADGAAFAAANPTVDLDAKYIYIYSIVNTGHPNNSNDQSLITFNVPVGSFATSVGAFQTSLAGLNGGSVAGNVRAAFTDEETTILTGNESNFVGSGRQMSINRRLGPGLVGPGSSDLINGTPSYDYAHDGGLGGDINDVGVTTINENTPIHNTVRPVSSALSAGNATFTFLLGDGAVSTLFFFTSDNAPKGYGAGTLTGFNGGASLGDVPVPSPEPATFALIGLGVALVGGAGFARRIRGGKKDAVTPNPEV